MRKSKILALAEDYPSGKRSIQTSNFFQDGVGVKNWQRPKFLMALVIP